MEKDILKEIRDEIYSHKISELEKLVKQLSSFQESIKIILIVFFFYLLLLTLFLLLGLFGIIK